MGLLSNPYLLDCAGNCLALGQGHFNFTKFAQDLLRTVSFSRHFYPLQEPEFLTFTLVYFLGGRSRCLGSASRTSTRAFMRTCMRTR